MHKKVKNEGGFTLFEFGMVMVIAALVVVAVTVGQDLIFAAKMRKLSVQLKEYISAAYAFQERYEYLPGDLPSSLASQYRLTEVTVCRANVRGCGGTGNGYLNTYEIPLFYYHLSMAKMIEQTAVEYTPNEMALDLEEDFPYTTLGRGGVTTGIDGVCDGTCFMVGKEKPEVTNGSLDALLKPIENHWLDAKLDDGFPLSGSLAIYNTQATKFFDTGFMLTSGPVIGRGGATSDVCAATGAITEYNSANDKELCAFLLDW